MTKTERMIKIRLNLLDLFYPNQLVADSARVSRDTILTTAALEALLAQGLSTDYDPEHCSAFLIGGNESGPCDCTYEIGFLLDQAEAQSAEEWVFVQVTAGAQDRGRIAEAIETFQDEAIRQVEKSVARPGEFFRVTPLTTSTAMRWLCWKYSTPTVAPCGEPTAASPNPTMLTSGW